MRCLPATHKVPITYRMLCVLQSACSLVTCFTRSDVQEVDVLVLGAGVSGIFAAVELDQQQVDFAILEGSDRIGGRVYSTNIGGYTVELGALWLHGSENPL